MTPLHSARAPPTEKNKGPEYNIDDPHAIAVTDHGKFDTSALEGTDHFGTIAEQRISMNSANAIGLNGRSGPPAKVFDFTSVDLIGEFGDEMKFREVRKVDAKGRVAPEERDKDWFKRTPKKSQPMNLRKRRGAMLPTNLRDHEMPTDVRTEAQKKLAEEGESPESPITPAGASIGSAILLNTR